MRAMLRDIISTGSFTWRWPVETEEFHQGWGYVADLKGHTFRIRHGLGFRTVYGRPRVHSVTWVNEIPRVEGVEADDYSVSRGLISILKRADKKHLRTLGEVGDDYNEFVIVKHSDEILAPFSPSSLAVKIVEDDLTRWAVHGITRSMMFEFRVRATPLRPVHDAEIPGLKEAPHDQHLIGGSHVVLEESQKVRLLSAGELADMQLKLRKLMDSLEQGEVGGAVQARVLRLRDEGRIPREIAGFMLNIITARNLLMHERRQPASSAFDAWVAEWRAIIEWAQTLGIMLEDP